MGNKKNMIGMNDIGASDARRESARDWAKIRQERMMNMPKGGESIWTKMYQAVAGVPSELDLDLREYRDKTLNDHWGADDRRDEIYNKVYNARAKGLEPRPEHQEAWARLLHSGEY